MRVLVWVLVWVVIVAVSALYLWGTVRTTWKSARRLGTELADAEERLSAVREQVDRLGEANGRLEELAVFADPATAARERRTTRESLRRESRDRRRRGLPAWARHVDS